MINYITCSNDCSDTNYISCSLCKKSLHLVCLFDTKVIKSKFPNNNNPPKYLSEILTSSYFHYTCIDCRPVTRTLYQWGQGPTKC